jgi:hypothetical protein
MVQEKTIRYDTDMTSRKCATNATIKTKDQNASFEPHLNELGVITVV